MKWPISSHLITWYFPFNVSNWWFAYNKGFWPVKKSCSYSSQKRSPRLGSEKWVDERGRSATHCTQQHHARTTSSGLNKRHRLLQTSGVPQNVEAVFLPSKHCLHRPKSVSATWPWKIHSTIFHLLRRKHISILSNIFFSTMIISIDSCNKVSGVQNSAKFFQHNRITSRH